jgi:hypothetical protein
LPNPRTESGETGSVQMPRDSSKAIFAVNELPLFLCASTMNVSDEIPAIQRLRSRKKLFSIDLSGANPLTSTPPCLTISRNSWRCWRG